MSFVSYLLAGPVHTTVERRAVTLDRMAAVLARTGAINSDQDAVRALLGNGFRIIDIGLLAGEARELALSRAAKNAAAAKVTP